MRKGIKLRAGMERLGVKRSLREDLPGEKAIDSQRDGVSVNVWEDSQNLDEDSENICKDLQDEKVDTQRGDFIYRLPEELVERILAMLPFPFVFQARVLSKSWLARLSPISSQDDEEMKHLAISFQKRISEQSINWKNFSPVICRTFGLAPQANNIFGAFDPQPKEDNILEAFDRTSHTRLRLPSLSFLPEKLRDCWISRLDQIEGSLLLFSEMCEGRDKQLHVANILTQSWKKLPPRPSGRSFGHTHLCHLIDKYKVIHIPETEASNLLNLLEFYDSTSTVWTSMKIISSVPRTLCEEGIDVSTVSSLDGVLYFLQLDRHNDSRVSGLKVFALNLNEGTASEKLNLVAEVTDTKLSKIVRSVEMVIWKVNLLMVILYTSRVDIIVVNIDLQSRHWNVCALRPGRAYMEERTLPVPTPVVSGGDLIFAYVRFDNHGHRAAGAVNAVVSDGDRVLAYDIHENSWDFLPYYSVRSDSSDGERKSGVCFYRVCASFRPGLNSFVAV